MGRLINSAQDDENVKVIFVHGGLFFSAGNELDILASGATNFEKDELTDKAALGIEHYMVTCLMAIQKSKKPIVALVRGFSIGISFTTASLYDFIYCTPEAKFSTPFMASCQSPEGSSTYSFAQQFGIRRANEILMLDKSITAQEAVQCGFANGIIDGLNKVDYFPDLSKIPTITKLLSTDYRTLVNCKELINAAKDNAAIEATITREARALTETWLEEDFPPKLMKYMSNIKKAKKAAKATKEAQAARPKL